MPRFVIQMPYAKSHHFDLRLGRDGVLIPWAIPEGMPDATEKNRLAMRVGDHGLSHPGLVDETPVGGMLGAVRKSMWGKGTHEAEEVGEEVVVVARSADPRRPVRHLPDRRELALAQDEAVRGGLR